MYINHLPTRNLAIRLLCNGQMVRRCDPAESARLRNILNLKSSIHATRHVRLFVCGIYMDVPCYSPENYVCSGNNQGFDFAPRSHAYTTRNGTKRYFYMHAFANLLFSILYIHCRSNFCRIYFFFWTTNRNTHSYIYTYAYTFDMPFLSIKKKKTTKYLN